MITSARKRLPAFAVHEVKTEEVLNFKNWWPKYFKKITKALPSTSSPGSVSYTHLDVYKRQNKANKGAED